MKNLLLILSILLCSCRVGDFTILSTKNVGDKQNCVLLQSGVKSSATNLKTAVDKCIEKVPGGMYLENVVLSEGMFTYKVKGDVWGKKPASN